MFFPFIYTLSFFHHKYCRYQNPSNKINLFSSFFT